jgi:hypothetical protein
MATERHPQSWPLYPLEPWPPDDTEESVLGTDLHQTTITYLRWAIHEAARVGLAPEESSPWRAFTQMAMLGCRRPDGTAYRTYPDLCVFRHSIEPTRGSLALDVDGPPVLIIEVLGEATYDIDLDVVRGKGWSYARAGVAEYLTIDPTRAYVSQGFRGWRLDDGAYLPWIPRADHRYQSQGVSMTVALEGVMAAVYLPDGQRVIGEGEVMAELARKDAELERLRRLLADQP